MYSLLLFLVQSSRLSHFVNASFGIVSSRKNVEVFVELCKFNFGLRCLANIYIEINLKGRPMLRKCQLC